MMYSKKDIIIYNEDECIIKDINGRNKYVGKFTTPVRAMIPTNVRSRYMLVTATNIETMNLK